MAKTINIEYTNPVTGAQATIQVTIDIDRYRVDTEEGATENFFLKGTASGASAVLENVDDLVSDLLDGRPSGARRGIVQSLVDIAFTAAGATLFLDGNPETLGFEANTPCVLLDQYGRVKDWFIPSAVGSSYLTIPTTGAASLEVDAEVGWIVQMAESFLSPLGENSMLGIKAQLERPTTPTAVTGSGTVSGGINAGWTKPADVVIAYYDIYCIKAATVPTSTQPNSLPSVADRAASLASSAVNLTQYFDQTTMELKALDAGTYFIGVVAKDGAGMVDVNESRIGWSAAVVIA